MAAYMIFIRDKTTDAAELATYSGLAGPSMAGHAVGSPGSRNSLSHVFAASSARSAKNAPRLESLPHSRLGIEQKKEAKAN